MIESIEELDALRGYPSWLEVAKTYARCHRTLTERLAPLDLSVAQHEVLLAVARDEGLSQQSLARRLLVVKSNVTAMIKRLEGRGLVRRESDKADARGRRVFLTAAGRRLLKKAVAVHAEVVRIMTSDLTDAEVTQLGQFMRTVGSSLERAGQK